MRNPNKIEPFLQKLGELWHHLPDYRFGQLIYRLADELGQDMFFPEEYERNNPKVEITRDDLYDLIKEVMNDKKLHRY